jgi:hypothetical protein
MPGRTKSQSYTGAAAFAIALSRMNDTALTKHEPTPLLCDSSLSNLSNNLRFSTHATHTLGGRDAPSDSPLPPPPWRVTGGGTRQLIVRRDDIVLTFTGISQY